MYPNNHDHPTADMTTIAAISELHHAFNQWLGEPEPRKRPAAYRRILQHIITQARYLTAPHAMPSQQEAMEGGD